MSISLVIPSRNNLKYAQFAYNSIRRHIGYDVEVILLDDASTDGTWEWMQSMIKTEDNTQIYRNPGPERVGHTVLYDVGAHMAKNEVFGIFHADMVASPNYVKHIMRNMQRGVVYSGTRIEPPLHPPGPEKIVFDFGMEPETFLWDHYLNFVKTLEVSDQFKGQHTEGIFAPWVCYKDDFFAIGGHDKRVFAPMELEDSDLFNRMMLKGYHLSQARDAFVYHMTCRGSRFKDGVKIVQEIPLGNGQVWKKSADSQEYTQLRQIKFRDWWRKWHMDVLHDQNMLPIVYPRYNMGFVVDPCPVELLPFIEPWCDTIYVKLPSLVIDDYVTAQQGISKFKMKPRVCHISQNPINDIVVRFDGTKFTQQHMEVIKQLPLMIQDSGEQGSVMEFDIFTLDIRLINPVQDRLIHADDPWYVQQLI